MTNCRFQFLCLSAVMLLTFFPLYAEEEDAASECFEKAAQYEKEEDWRAAANYYRKAESFAQDPVQKANALLARVLACRKAKLYGEEFDCIEKLIQEHLSRIDFTRMVNREFQIGDDFFNGHRDVVFTWLPFITEADRTMEIYEAALKHASCAPQAPDTRLRLGRMYLDRQKPEKAIAKFRETILLHPDSDAARYSRLELAHTYVVLASRGDGDGAWAKLAMSSLSEFIEKHPNDPEVHWAKKSMETVRKIIVKRNIGVAKFYHRSQRDDLAVRYLSATIREFPGTEDVIPAEKMLAEIDKDYKRPPETAERVPQVKFEFQRSAIPLERSDILTVPENSDGKWLFPVRDLKGDVRIDSNKPLPERKFNDEENEL